jgi:hypothetical protein
MKTCTKLSNMTTIVCKQFCAHTSMKKRRPWMRNWESPPLKRLLEKPVNFEG